MDSEYGIFDNAGSCSLDNDIARNLIMFSIDNSLSSHSDNHKNNSREEGLDVLTISNGK